MQKNNKMMRGLLVFVGIIAVTVVVSMMMTSTATGQKTEISMSEFNEAVQLNNVESVLLIEDTIYGRYVDHLSSVSSDDLTRDYDFTMAVSSVDAFQSEMQAIVAKGDSKLSADEVTTADYGFEYDYRKAKEDSLFVVFLPYIIIVVFFVGLWMLFSKQIQGNNNKATSFGKSRHRMASKEKNDKHFSDVAGAVEEKAELAEIVDFLKDPDKFLKLGARIPKGILLVGPPGTGKTLMAKAVAGEADVPFFTISGSDFVEMYVGVGASRVRDLFEQAKKKAPCIIFIDEIDAVGRHRGSGLGGGHDEREQTLNQMLVEMDGFSQNDSVIVMAATNRKDILDPALLRPGRFDRQITVGYPDVKGREEILVVHSKNKPLSSDVKLTTISRLTPFFTGADLENLMNEAAILAARENKAKINMIHIKEAITRVQLGPEKKSYKVTEKDKKLVAYHEAGHAIVAHNLEYSDPVHEVSIIPRGGGAGGYTQTLASEDDKFMTKAKLLDILAMSMGGNVAEQLVLGDVSTGSASDLKHASEIARRMVTEWGMSDSIGPVYLGGEKEIFIGRDLGHSRNYSEQLSARIDMEVHKLLDAARNRALDIVKKNRDMMDALVEVLLEREKLDGAEFAIVMEGGELPPIVEEVEEPVPTKPDEVSKEATPTDETVAVKPSEKISSDGMNAIDDLKTTDETK